MAFIAYDPGSLAQQSRKRLRSLQKYGLPTAQEYQRISETIAPQENALALRQLQQFAPQLQTLGLGLQRQQQMGGIENDLATLLGPGQDLVANALQLDRLVNPEFYGFREQAAGGLQRLLAAQDPSRLSGSELAETERGLNRLNTARGNINVTDATTTAANAGAFGSALAGKQARFGQALSLIPSLSGVSRSPLDAFGIATGRNNMANPLGPQNVSTGSQVGQNINQSQQQDYLQNQQIRAQAKTGSDAFEGGVGACLSCFLFKEFYGYPDVPMFMRWSRDNTYKKNPRIGIGYRRMSIWIIPWMRRYSLVRSIILHTCIVPLTKYCLFQTGYTKKWGYLKVAATFWRKVWSFLGK